MVINENNSHINSFAQGMNSDTAYDVVGNSQYVFGKNIRITKNILLGEDKDDVNYASVHEGVITPILYGKTYDKIDLKVEDYYNSSPEILAVKTINDIGIIIAKYEEEELLCVYKFTVDDNDDITYINYDYLKSEDGLYVVGGPYWFPWWKVSISEVKEQFKDVKQVSAVLYQELEGVIKLYIATGVYPIIEIRVDDNVHYDSHPIIKQQVDNFINNRILPQYPVYIENKIAGQLKTSQVQYTYRYYNKFGTTTQLAPLTNKIQVIDSNRNKEVGNAQDTITSVGFTLKVRGINNYNQYERIQIFRLQYIKPGEDANVSLIYDGEVKVNVQNNNFVFNDVGGTALAELTMEEFSSMSGLIIIPKVIEQNQQYLFASNVKDDTIIQGVTVDGGEVDMVNSISVTLSNNLEEEPRWNNNNYNSNASREYFEDRNINSKIVYDSYNDIFTSSLLRSLRRGEDYYYAIVYYDKYGRRTNAIPIKDSDNGKLSVNNNNYSEISGNSLITTPIGAKITLPQPKIDEEIAKDIIGCQIIRRSSKPMYQKTLLQVAMAMPINQLLYTTTYKDEDTVIKTSPLYPTGFLFSGVFYYSSLWYWWDREKTSGADDKPSEKMKDYAHTGDENGNGYGIWQIYSNEIDFARDDVMSKLQSESISANINNAYHVSLGSDQNVISEIMNKHLQVYNNTKRFDHIGYSGKDGNIRLDDGVVLKIPALQDPSSKSSEYMLFPFYKNAEVNVNMYENNKHWPTSLSSDIESIKDVKLPQWSDGFSNIQINGTDLSAGGIKKYKQFTTNIGGKEYNNWCSSGTYDMRITQHDAQPNLNEFVSQFIDTHEASDWSYIHNIQNQKPFTVSAYGDIFPNFDGVNDHCVRHVGALRHIGPGPSCFLISTKEKNPIVTGYDPKVYICNIQHNISNTVNSEPDEFIQYYGFGNWFNLKFEDGKYKVEHSNRESDDTMIVYDGDMYVTPHELITMFKTYDFTSVDTIPSMQIVNYIPLESKVNTYFDYGMNFLNTHSANLLLEPGSIDGITTQDRPLHQYNQIYSANDESNDVFSLIKEENENNFRQRTFYSEPKINGEYVDNFVIFKAAAFIDVDGKYGEITNLLTDKNTLYYWQNHAFGKFSVNERSLINDQNGNTIMLGQAGILSRNDYISTKYGMRSQDFCAIGAENGIYWIDINNKAIVAGSSNECINFGERLNVQNIINSKLSTNIPKINYDLQNNELICNCLTSTDEQTLDQIVFNLKLNVATSVYNRDYNNIANIKNSIYGIKKVESELEFVKYNNLYKKDNVLKFLQPMQFSFLVNPSASTTKVFDSQQLIPAKRKAWEDKDLTTFFEDCGGTLTFETDINKSSNDIKPYTDREGNITYNIPRFGNDDYGNRLRGKWMKVDFNIKNPTEYTTVSHIITKFRQSYS